MSLAKFFSERPQCTSSFSSDTEWKQHEEEHRKEDLLLNNSVSSSVESTQKKARNKCLDCGLQYKTQQTLKRHRRKQHGAGYEKDIWHKCMVEECGLKFMQVKSLTEHMVSHHHMNMGIRELEFNSSDEFF
ncbi:zinc finger and SCAN domain-containing protein 16-like [Corticium candelabrum]|uniref:zinc finger and SCAN domain-containing protein 16-like n=1 Tax=Corticium candelabrum TaxID=121492 RepID=UPI002E255007|nr:zinc finger and SCAN domain-containing protein 16-like [Corticium candelabrum]